MASINKWVANIILLVTGVLFFILLSSMIFLLGQDSKFISIILPSIIICFSIFTFILNLLMVKRGYIYFLSSLVFFCSIWMLLMQINIVLGSVKNWWPLIGIFSGVSLLFSGHFHHKKWHFGYIIPSVVLFIMGIWFLMFSLKIIVIPFIDVVLICGPLLLLLCFVLLFVLFYYQKVNKTFVLKDDEYTQFEDDYYNPKKSD